MTALPQSILQDGAINQTGFATLKQAPSVTRPRAKATRKRGRPDPVAGEEALNNLHRVAYIHFIVNGVEDASMLAIAREAGVSRQMIHNRFGNKQQFFEAIVQAGENHLLKKFDVVAMPATTDPWILFNFIGNEISNVILDPQQSDVFRVMNVACYKHPEVAATHQASLDKAYAMFGRLLKTAGKNLNTDIANIKSVSRDFLALIYGFTLPIIQGRQVRPSAAAQRREISSIVDRFLRGIGFEKPVK